MRGCLLLGWLGLAVAAARGEDLMALPEAVFAARPELAARMNPAALDRDLLAAAVFHETNRARRGHGLPAFLPLAKLNDAAEIQANVGAILVPPSHTSPIQAFATPLDRVRFVGLHPDRLAENIALLPAFEIDPAAGVAMRMEGGRRVFFHPETGALLEYATYGWFARTLVRVWMESPGHRANILDPSLRYLGCSARPTRSLFGADMIFGVQEFYTPERGFGRDLPRRRQGGGGE